MPPSVLSLQIAVVPSPETNDHEVRLLDGGEDIIQRFDDSMIGLDPSEILVSPCPLLPTDAPHHATIARCDCGVTGCGSVQVSIERHGEQVAWCDVHSSTRVLFLAKPYEAEVRRALADFSWETPDRTTGRLVAQGVDRSSLRRRSFEFNWASGKIVSGQTTVALTLTPGPYQVLIHFETAQLTPTAAAERCIQGLKQRPEDWPRVTWYAQAPGLPDLPIRSDRWTKGTA